MREILFRGKRVDNGEWIKGGYYKDYCYGNKLGEKTYITEWNTFGLGFIDNIQVDHNTIGQFTGLTDKNGVKIFEGDIVKSITHFYGNQQERITVISFEEIENDSFGEPYTIGYAILGSEYEVIGNIHDNTELLSDKKS